MSRPDHSPGDPAPPTSGAAGVPSSIDDELYSEEVIADPYPYYARIRELDPVHWNPRYDTWLVTRYADVLFVLRHPELFSSRFYSDDPLPPAPPVDDGDEGETDFVARFRSQEIIQNDPPDHTRLRMALNRFFTPSSIARRRKMVRTIVHGLLDKLGGRDGFDVREDLGAPLPLLVISALLGIPESDRALLKEHADRRMQSALGLQPDRMRQAASGIRDTSVYLERALERRLARRGPEARSCAPDEDDVDLIDIFVAGEQDGTYSRGEVLANIQGLIDAGHETTIQLICNGVLAFLRHPAQWELFCADPESLAARATDECLRFDPPLTAPRRLAATDLELGGKLIRRGERVTYVIAAACRDPRAYPDPDVFDISRQTNRRIAFGSGIHSCLGQHLARLEGEEVLTALAQRAPALCLASDRIEYAKIRGVRSMLALPVAATVAPART